MFVDCYWQYFANCLKKEMCLRKCEQVCKPKSIKIENYPEIWRLAKQEIPVLNNSNLQRLNYEYEMSELQGPVRLGSAAKILRCDS